jgi:hypothetical protein
MLGVNRHTKNDREYPGNFITIDSSLTLCFRLLHRLQARATRPLRLGPGVACG